MNKMIGVWELLLHMHVSDAQQYNYTDRNKTFPDKTIICGYSE